MCLCCPECCIVLGKKLLLEGTGQCSSFPAPLTTSPSVGSRAGDHRGDSSSLPPLLLGSLPASGAGGQGQAPTTAPASTHIITTAPASTHTSPTTAAATTLTPGQTVSQ